MASATGAKKLREEATCPICLELMTEPVIIDCEHIYCLECIVRVTGNRSSETSSPGTLHCPQCREPFKIDSIRSNKKLASIIEIIKETKQERLCEKHGEQLHLFREDDSQLICWHGEQSPKHKGHVTALVEDKSQGHKEHNRKAVTQLKAKELKYMQQKEDTIKKISDWEETIKNVEERIHSEYGILHTFLHQEEEIIMCQLKEEKEQKLSKLKDNVDFLDNKLQELRNQFLNLDKKNQVSSQNLLQDTNATLDSNSAIYVEIPEDVSLEVNTVCNVSEFNFYVRKILKRYQDYVTLDPDTAHLDLQLSNNQRTVTYKGSIPMYPNPAGLSCILGHERFTSGRHYFEVDVREGTEWGVGVCLENVPRDIDTGREPQSGFWAIRLRKDKRNLALSSPPTTLYLRAQPKVVGIFLDCDTGLVSFYNATTGSHIYIFPKASFSHALRPYFEVYPSSSFSLVSSNE